MPRFDNEVALSIKEVAIKGNKKWRDLFFAYRQSACAVVPKLR